MKTKTDWFPPRGSGVSTCDPAWCPFYAQCQAIEAHPNGIIGLGCEVLRLDERPDQFERDSTVMYRSVDIEKAVRIDDAT